MQLRVLFLLVVFVTMLVGPSAQVAAASSGEKTPAGLPACSTVTRDDLVQFSGGWQQYSMTQAATLRFPIAAASFYATHELVVLERVWYRDCVDGDGQPARWGVAAQAAFAIDREELNAAIGVAKTIEGAFSMGTLKGEAHMLTNGFQAGDVPSLELPLELNRTEMLRFQRGFTEILAPAVDKAKAKWVPLKLAAPVGSAAIPLEEIGYQAFAVIAIARGWTMGDAVKKLPSKLAANPVVQASLKVVYEKLGVGMQAEPNEIQKRSAKKIADSFADAVPLVW